MFLIDFGLANTFPKTRIKVERVTIGTTGKKPKVKLAGIIFNAKPINAASPTIIERMQLRGLIFLPYKAAITVGNKTAKPVKA